MGTNIQFIKNGKSLDFSNPCAIKIHFRGKEGENLPVVQKCDILKQYCEFMEIVFHHQAELKEQPTNEEMQGCYEKAIKEAISKGILVDYLTRKGTEVRNMFIGEYDYDLDMQVKAEEAREEGLAEGQQQKAIEDAINLLKMKLGTLEQIAQATCLPVEKIQELQKNISIIA